MSFNSINQPFNSLNMKPMNNILITGGAGFIGSHLSLKLLEKGYNITILDNLSPQIHGENATDSYLFNSIKDKVRFIYGDVRNRADLETALEGQNVVVHLAAETGTGQSMYQIHKYSDVNIGGTALLLDILTNSKTHNVGKIIIASSRAIYGEGRYLCASHGHVYPEHRKEEDLLNGKFECRCPQCGKDIDLLPTDEDAKIMAQSIYAVTKYNQEQMCLIIGRSLNIPTIAFRYQNVYGPGQSLSNPYTGILSVFSTRIKNHQPLNIFEDGNESRDFVYIDDVVNATIKGIESDNIAFKSYNVGSGSPVTVLNIAKRLIDLYQSDVELTISGNYRLGDIRHNFADLTLINNDFNFSPKYGIEEGLKNFVGWVNQQEIKEDAYSKSLDELKKRGMLKESIK
jgi:dTDP-L-rhamnose 4-epimerase